MQYILVLCRVCLIYFFFQGQKGKQIIFYAVHRGHVCVSVCVSVSVCECVRVNVSV